MHLLIDIAAGISMRNSGAPVFFCTQVFGITIEDMVSGAYCYLLGREGTQQHSRLEKVIGYMWVVAFLVWSAPVYLYPTLYRANTGLNDSVVPVSLVSLLLQSARYG
jgi:membrane protein DedA with SNARE-associated domain